MDIENFTLNYLDRLGALLKKVNRSSVSAIVTCLEKAIEQHARIYILGNGGSAATAAHMVNDLGAGLNRRDVRKFNIINLADNASVCTALANDVGYDNIFYYQLRDVIKPNDIVIAISCSGNSPNILKAVDYAKKQGAIIVGATGFDGGQLKPLSDVAFHVDTAKGDYGLVEDMHMILNHIIYSYYVSLVET
ncbi:MAG: SIS domain-containing protein [Pseudomonadota bacterium]